MRYKKLGRTGLLVTENSFGALPIQRRNLSDSKEILRHAFDSGINFFDTARMYTDSEEKIGYALSDVRQQIIIATKTQAVTYDGVFKDLETSLKNLKTDYIDIYQLHNPPTLPDPNDPKSSYAAIKEAQKNGMIRFLGITSHRLNNAEAAVDSGLYDTLQFPISYISRSYELAIVDRAKRADVGLIAMKALSGGLLTNAAACFAFFRTLDNAVPIWGIQTKEQLNEFLDLAKQDVSLNEQLLKVIEKDKAELSGEFCRGCGYCQPCMADIRISWCARMDMLLTRSVWQNLVTDEWQKEMQKIESCTNCGLCKKKCPYGLDTPTLLKKQLKNYQEFCAKNKI